jgi:hypothetical protein
MARVFACRLIDKVALMDDCDKNSIKKTPFYKQSICYKY